VRLSAKQKKLLHEFQQACDEQTSPLSAGFVDQAKQFFSASSETQKH